MQRDCLFCPVSSWSTFPRASSCSVPLRESYNLRVIDPKEFLVYWGEMTRLFFLYKTIYLSLKSVSCSALETLLTRLSWSLSPPSTHVTLSIMMVAKTSVLAHRDACLGSQGKDWLKTWKTDIPQPEISAMETGTIMQTWLICCKERGEKSLCRELLFPSCSWTDGALSCFINVISKLSL